VSDLYQHHSPLPVTSDTALHWYRLSALTAEVDVTRTIPDEILLRVMQLLDTKALLVMAPAVCRRWRRLASILKHPKLDLSFVTVGHRQTLGCDRIRSMLDGLTRRFPTATSLQLQECYNLTDSALMLAASRCPQLTSVDVSRDPNLTGIACSRHFTNLAVVSLAQSCTGLTSFNVSGSAQLTDGAIVTLAQHCHGLRHLHLKNCQELTGLAIAVLARSCKNLTTIDLGNCNRIDDKSMAELADGCPGLVRICLRFCHKLGDQAIIQLARNCSQLQVIDLRYCAKITDDSVRALARNCSRLREAYFHGCVNLTNRAVTALANRGSCPDIHSVDFNACDKITCDWQRWARGLRDTGAARP